MKMEIKTLCILKRSLALISLTFMFLHIKAEVADSLIGVVKDITTHKFIAGAKIQYIDNSSIAMTNDSGVFKISLTPNQHTIIVSAPGYNIREFSVFRNSNIVLINLYPDTYSNFYTKSSVLQKTIQRTIESKSINSLNIDNYNSVSVESEIQKNPTNNIRTIQHSGIQGAGSSLFIRGYNTLNANSQPLFVVDGMVYDNLNNWSSLFNGNIINGLSCVDVNDVESINIIKDGATIYGSKAGNGVIEISTRRGKDIVTRITASTMAGYNTEPEFMPTLNSAQYRIYLSDLLKSRNDGNSNVNFYFLNDDPSFLYYKKYHNATNWKKLIYRSSMTQSYHVAANGGDDIALYNLSMGYTKAQSTIKENDMTRLNARFNSNVWLGEKLTTSFDISYTQVTKSLRNDGIPESSNNSVIDAPGYLSLIKAPFLSPYQYTNNGNLSSKLENFDFLGIANPLAINAYGVGAQKQSVFNLTVRPEYRFTQLLSLKSQFSYNLSNLSENSFRPMYGVSPYFNSAMGIISLNQVKTQFVKQINVLSDTRLNWEKQILLHHIDIMGGLRFLQSGINAEYASGHNTGSDEVQEMSSSLNYKSVGGIDDSYRSLNYYVMGSYNFSRKYIIETALSMESNSRFGKETKNGLSIFGVSWALFPSLNAAWVISSEDFMKSAMNINHLKIRIGYGLTGNDGIESTTSQTYFNAVRYYLNAVGTQINNIANPQIQWETVIKRNIGMDADIFDSKVNIGIDIYNNTTNNLLVVKSLNQISGLINYYSNDGKLENKGVEFTLNSKLISIPTLQVEFGASLAFNQNKILSLPDGNYTTSVYGGEILTAVGKPIGQFYGYQTSGVFSSADEASAANLSYRTKTGKLIAFKAGDIHFSDNLSDGILDEKDKTVIGNSQPDFHGNINLSTRYKRIKVDFLFNYVYGNEIYNYLRSQLESGSTYNNQTTALLNRWRSEGQQTDVPKSTYEDPQGNNRFSDRWIEDGSYLRLKNFQLSYELPINSTFIQGFNIWGSVSNLFTLTKYLGSDPEFSGSYNVLFQGIDHGVLAQSRSFNVGLKINL